MDSLYENISKEDKEILNKFALKLELMGESLRHSTVYKDVAVSMEDLMEEIEKDELLDNLMTNIGNLERKERENGKGN